MVLAHLSADYNRSRYKYQNLWGWKRFPTDDIWFGSDTDTNCAVLYDLYLDV